MFDLLVGSIAAPLAKFPAKQWLGDTAAGVVAGGTIDYLKGRLGSERAARRAAARQVEELAEQIVDGLQPYFEYERNGTTAIPSNLMRRKMPCDTNSVAIGLLSPYPNSPQMAIIPTVHISSNLDFDHEPFCCML